MLRYTEEQVKQRIKEISQEQGKYQEVAIDFWFMVLALFRLTEAKQLSLYVELGDYPHKFSSIIHIQHNQKIIRTINTDILENEATMPKLSAVAN